MTERVRVPRKKIALYSSPSHVTKSRGEVEALTGEPAGRVRDLEKTVSGAPTPDAPGKPIQTLPSNRHRPDGKDCTRRSTHERTRSAYVRAVRRENTSKR